MTNTPFNLREKILREMQKRDKRRDNSVLDRIDKENPIIRAVVKYQEKKEVELLITNWSNKTDLIKQFIDLIPYYYDEAGMWWKWNNKEKFWVIDDEVNILNLINGSSNANIIRTKERTEMINALKQEARRKKPKEVKQTWLQFKDEVVDIETGERFEATPEYLFTNPIPYYLGKNEETPIIDKIFEEWVGEKYVRTLYEIIAYCLIPDYPIHRLFCFIGSGMNGKSCYLNLLKKFVGEQNVCSTELDTLLMSRFGVTKLHKKLVCLMGETNFNEMTKTSIIKKLTGGDLIGFEYKNKNPFDEKNYAKILIATNNLPTTSDKTIGFYRRWLIIDFPNRFSEKKDILAEIPEEEYENLAMKSVGILMDLIDKREFHNEGTVEERMAKYEAKSDFLQHFLDEFVEESINNWISKAEFRKKFSEWCRENRHREMAENTLSKKLKSKGIESGRKQVDWAFDGKGGQIRVYLDIKWKT